MLFYLNDQKIKYKGNQDLSLLSYLRDSAGIKSVKDGCSGQAVCGCCTVEIDGKTFKSCTYPMKKIEGKKVITIEGWSSTLKETFAYAFAKKGGFQCGFCTPGIVMQAKLLIDQNPHPSTDDINKILSRHLCRCTGYQKIVESIIYAASLLSGLEPNDESIIISSEHSDLDIVSNEHSDLDIMSSERTHLEKNINGKVGTRLFKYNAGDIVLGQSPFVCDLTSKDLAFASLRFSDHPRALVKKIDVNIANQLAGVLRVFTAQDIPGKRHNGLITEDWPLMIKEGEETRYVGDVLAGVVAQTPEIAKKAVSLIDVQYQELEPVVDVMKATQPDAPSIHDEGNILGISQVKRGDVNQAFLEAAYVTEGNFTTQRVEHAFLEPESCLAVPIDVDDKRRGLRVYSGGQGVYEDRRQLSQILNIEQERIHVLQVASGGAFGGKEDLSVQGHAALYAYLLDKPVKITLTRPESMRMHPKRHPFYMQYKLACDKQGKLTALKASIIGDTGAYASVGMKVVERGVGHATGAYTIPNVDIEGTAVYTNNSPCGAMRGFGVNQVTFAMESCVDDLCRQGGFDRWQFRYDNAIINGSVTSTGQIIEAGAGVRATLEAVKEVFYKAPYAGIACGIKNTGVGNGMHDIGECKIVIGSVNSNNKVIVHHGWTEMGQGVHTMAVQTVCEELGISPYMVEVKVDTKEDTPCGMTTSSRGTSLVANSLIDACKKLRSDLEKVKFNFARLAGKEYKGKWVCDWTFPPGVNDKPTHYSYGYATQVVTLSKKGKIDTVYAAHDAGRIMNPTLFEGQIEGAIHMGLGYALSEEYPMEEGRPVIDKLAKCGIVKAKDVPKVVVKGIEVKDPVGPYGVKGIGEIGMVPTAAAVAGSATQFDGERRYSLPLREKLLL